MVIEVFEVIVKLWKYVIKIFSIKNNVRINFLLVFGIGIRWFKILIFIF